MICNAGISCDELMILIIIFSDKSVGDLWLTVRLQHVEEDKDERAKMIDKGDEMFIVWLQKDRKWAKKQNEVFCFMFFFVVVNLVVKLNEYFE